jgi:hypothetical protein
MLFTDGIILTIQDLREHDNYVLEIANTESIELSSKLAIAQRSVGYELASFLASRETSIGLDRVVVNEELRDLLAVQTLAAIYADAYNRHLNDRYLGRAKEFRQTGERSFQRFLHNGVGISGSAVARASLPVVSNFSGGDLQPGSYVVQIAWEHLARTVGEKSEMLIVDCFTGGLSISPTNRPINMAGWHAFIGPADGTIVRQNVAAIEPNGTWEQRVALRYDLPVTDPSGPDYYVRQAGQMVRR